MSETQATRYYRTLMVVAIAAYAAFIMMAYPGVLRRIAVPNLGQWFMDSYAILASSDAMRAGLDPWEINPLDPLGRPHVYSHWWLHLGAFGLTRSHVNVFGLGLGVLFFVTALAGLRPRSFWEMGWYLALLCAPPVVLGVERANNDLVVFVLLAAVVPCLLSPKPIMRWLALLPVALATGLKFYPSVAALVLLAGHDSRELRQRLLIGGLLLGLVALNVAPDLAHIGGRMPRPSGPMSLGSIHMLGAAGLQGLVATVAGIAAAVLIAAAFLRSGIFAGWRLAPEQRGAWWSFVLGAVLLTGCFFAGASLGYRWIFAVWLAPLLWHLHRSVSTPAKVRQLARITAGLLIFAMWGDGLFACITILLDRNVPAAVLEVRAARFFLFSQPLVWVLFACLIGFLAHFAREAWGAISGRRDSSLAG